MRHAVILAGGAGKRLWPMSRLKRPKQLLPLLGGKNLLQLAIERLEGLFDHRNMLVVTSAEYIGSVAESLPQLPPENLVGEPQGRDTANAIALAAEILAAKDPQGTMAVFTADHVIRPAERFRRAVELACQAAERHSDGLLTFGIRPTWPHTGLGYIHCGAVIEDGMHEVIGFKEKPDHGTARRYVEGGQYYWNSGMFVWKLSAIRDAIRQFLPQSASKLEPVGRAVREGREYGQLLAEIYPTLERISIDYAVMEKAHKVIMVELNCEWLDIGAWPALEDVTDLDEAGNVTLARSLALLDSARNILVSEDDGHLLAVLGMDDCIVIHTPDATLVCNKSDAQRVKEFVELIEKQCGGKFI